MHEEDDLRGLAKTMDVLRAVSVLFLGIHFYWYGYPLFRNHGLTCRVADEILIHLNEDTGLFSEPLYTLLFCLLFLGLSCLGARGIKDKDLSPIHIVFLGLIGFLLFFSGWFPPLLPVRDYWRYGLYIFLISAGYLLLLMAGTKLSRLMRNDLLKDIFNVENESFPQETRLLENEYSVNMKTRFYWQGKALLGYINICLPFRSTMVLGTPGSGKSFAVINSFIKQHIEKGFAMYLYDFKFNDLSTIAYNTLLKNYDKYTVPPEFYVINLDDPRYSNRCNPIAKKFLIDISDAYESAYVILLNLNKTWIQKQGDFFVESPINLLAAIIWFLRIYEDGKYCTFPHAVEFLNKNYEDIFPILASYPQLENYLSPFIDAWVGGASDQLMGQIASAKIPLSRVISPNIYWIMSADDFTLDINNPKSPKILCVGNNPDRQNIYGAALGLYNARINKEINRKGRLKCSVIKDELPTIYDKGLDNLIATARSNKVSVCLGFQDFSQLKRDYGDKEAAVIQNTVGNVIAGQVVGESAKTLSERFGRIVQQRATLTESRNDVSHGINTQLDSLIPASKISNLTQGFFVGSVADNIDEPIPQKVFYGEIVVDVAAIKEEEKSYVPLPQIYDFSDAQGNDRMKEVVDKNYFEIKNDVKKIVASELWRIKNDPALKHLIK